MKLRIPKLTPMFAGLMLLVSAQSGPARAGEADVVSVRVSAESADLFRFEVSVEHADSGWEHYADAWEVLTLDGELLGRRVLFHPHVDEQPFTRSLSGVEIPAAVKEVRIRARDSVHGYGGQEQRLPIPGR